MRKRSVLALSLAAMLTVSMLSACSSAPKNSSSSSTPSTSTSSGASGNLVYWSMWSSTEPQAGVIKTAVSEFEKANPNVKITVDFQGRNIKKIEQTAIESGQQIDIFEDDPSNVLANMGKDLLPLDKYLSQPAVGMSGKTVKDSLQPTFLSYIANLAKSNKLTDGTYYGIPEQPYAVLVFYDKTLFKKAGITSVPKNWSDFMNTCAQLKSANITPIIWDDAYQDQFIGAYLASAMGSDWVNQLVTDKTGQMWNNPIILQMAKDVSTMAKDGYFSSTISSTKYPAGEQQLALDKVAIYPGNGTWLPNEVASTAGPDYQWGCFNFPQVPNGNGKGGQSALNLGCQGLFITKNCKSPDTAFKLISYLVSQDTQTGMSNSALAIPATVNTSWPSQLSDAQAIFSQATTYMPWGFGIDNAGSFSTGTIIPTFMQLVEGKLTSAQYVSAMVSSAKKYYANK